jgi:hypothetical protein
MKNLLEHLPLHYKHIAAESLYEVRKDSESEELFANLLQNQPVTYTHPDDEFEISLCVFFATRNLISVAYLPSKQIYKARLTSAGKAIAKTMQYKIGSFFLESIYLKEFLSMYSKLHVATSQLFTNAAEHDTDEIKHNVKFLQDEKGETKIRVYQHSNAKALQAFAKIDHENGTQKQLIKEYALSVNFEIHIKPDEKASPREKYAWVSLQLAGLLQLPDGQTNPGRLFYPTKAGAELHDSFVIAGLSDWSPDINLNDVPTNNSPQQQTDE